MYDVDFDQDYEHMYNVDEDDYEYLQSIYLGWSFDCSPEGDGWDDEDWNDEYIVEFGLDGW